jgi:hypothetical protein
MLLAEAKEKHMQKKKQHLAMVSKKKEEHLAKIAGGKKESKDKKQAKKDAKEHINQEKLDASFRSHFKWDSCAFDSFLPPNAKELNVPQEDFDEVMNAINHDLLGDFAKRWADPKYAKQIQKGLKKIGKYIVPTPIRIALNSVDSVADKVQTERRKKQFEKNCVPALQSFLEELTVQSEGKLRVEFRYVMLTPEEQGELKWNRSQNSADKDLESMKKKLENSKLKESHKDAQTGMLNKLEKVDSKVTEVTTQLTTKIEETLDKVKQKINEKNPEQAKLLEELASSKIPCLLFFVK